MIELLWIVAGVALGLVLEHVVLPWTAFLTRSYRPTQRLWHFPQSRRGLLLAKMASDRRVFEASQDLYESAPEELLDEFDDLYEWLREDQYTEPDVEEIYLVARPWFRPRSINGVLYASLYREFKPTSGPEYSRSVCFVSVVCAHDHEPESHKAKIADSLWRRLCEEIPEEQDYRPCDVYFQFPRRLEDGLHDHRSFFRMFFSGSARAQRLDVNYKIPDFDEHGRLGTHDGILLHARRGSSQRALNASDVAEFVYGVVHLWAFAYQGEASGFALARLRDRTSALSTLSADLIGQANASGELELLPI